jgi:hypothetical protein
MRTLLKQNLNTMKHKETIAYTLNIASAKCSAIDSDILELKAKRKGIIKEFFTELAKTQNFVNKKGHGSINDLAVFLGVQANSLYAAHPKSLRYWCDLLAEKLAAK